MGGDDTRKAIAPGGARLPPYLDPRADQTVVKRVAVDFLNRYVKHAGSALSALSRDGNMTGAATISTTPSLTGMRSTCRPGAP
jgi:hypothetical protein